MLESQCLRLTLKSGQLNTIHQLSNVIKRKAFKVWHMFLRVERNVKMKNCPSHGKAKKKCVEKARQKKGPLNHYPSIVSHNYADTFVSRNI